MSTHRYSSMDSFEVTFSELSSALQTPGAINPALATHVLAQLRDLGRAIEQERAA